MARNKPAHTSFLSMMVPGAAPCGIMTTQLPEGRNGVVSIGLNAGFWKINGQTKGTEDRGPALGYPDTSVHSTFLGYPDK